MRITQRSERVRKVAKELDNYIEKKDIENVLSCFEDKCEIELFGISLNGKSQLKKALNWLYELMEKVKFIPITIMIEDNIFFEEFVLSGKKKNKSFNIKAAEVLIYNKYKLKNLRLYLDRLYIAEVLSVIASLTLSGSIQ